jgi:hypothetical protein
MPGAPRPNKAAMKIAYKLLNTPKDLRQVNKKQPDLKRLREWSRDSSTAQ